MRSNVSYYLNFLFLSSKRNVAKKESENNKVMFASYLRYINVNFRHNPMTNTSCDLIRGMAVSKGRQDITYNLTKQRKIG